MAAPPLTPPDVDLTLWAASIALLGFVWGPKAAQFVTAYAFILFGWFAGLLIGLYRRDPDAKMPAKVYAFVTLVISLAVSVPIAHALQEYSGVSLPVALIPVDFVMSAAPDTWAELAPQGVEVHGPLLEDEARATFETFAARSAG